jgi:flavin reductase (DIM6/NTAB) family NADH-FMN oxidoreductase RutF
MHETAKNPDTHITIEPAILYFGTPVVLLSTLNEDDSPNLAPMSSAWWLGWRAMLGLGTSGKTLNNLRRRGECVLNLPSVHQADAVDRLALLTGSNPVPPAKHDRGYRHEKHKFPIANLTPVPSETVKPPRVEECPVQLEADVAAIHGIAEEDPHTRGRLAAIEVRITRVHVRPSILMTGHTDRIDPDKWRPLIMSFQHFYGLTPEKIHTSRLASIPESKYRMPVAPATSPCYRMTTLAREGEGEYDGWGTPIAR